MISLSTKLFQKNCYISTATNYEQLTIYCELNCTSLAVVSKMNSYICSWSQYCVQSEL